MPLYTPTYNDENLIQFSTLGLLTHPLARSDLNLGPDPGSMMYGTVSNDPHTLNPAGKKCEFVTILKYGGSYTYSPSPVML